MFAGKLMMVAGLTALSLAVPAMAQKDGDSSGKERDPNEVVCEKSGVLGSRLATKKTCMTRAEWAEKRRLERMEIDRVQVQRGSCEKC